MNDFASLRIQGRPENPTTSMITHLHTTLLTFSIITIIICSCGPKTPENRLHNPTISEIDNALFKQDPHWRGADGAKTIDLKDGRILWLFSDTFIDQDGTGKRSNARFMIRNSIAIQEEAHLDAPMKFYYGGNPGEPADFFPDEGDEWYWTGHGAVLDSALVVFLFRVHATDTGLGFEVVGWDIVLINNPGDPPDEWNKTYIRGPDTHGIIAGSSTVLTRGDTLYTFGVQEPDTHDTYLLRISKDQLLTGDWSGLEWWVEGEWTREMTEAPLSSALFTGITEFSVHYDSLLHTYVQVQTFGFGEADLGYRTAPRLEGPWSGPVRFYKPSVIVPGQMVYTAYVHPALSRHGEWVITYNTNHPDFDVLMSNEEIYFPKIVRAVFR